MGKKVAPLPRELFIPENPLPPPTDLLRFLRIYEVPVARDCKGNPVSANSLKGMFHQQAGFCCYCTKPMTLPSQPVYPRALTDAVATPTRKIQAKVLRTQATREHITPKSRGGPGTAYNFAAACSYCNSARGDLPLLTFLLGRKIGTLGELRRKFYAFHKLGLQLQPPPQLLPRRLRPAKVTAGVAEILRELGAPQLSSRLAQRAVAAIVRPH